MPSKLPVCSFRTTFDDGQGRNDPRWGTTGSQRRCRSDRGRSRRTGPPAGFGPPPGAVVASFPRVAGWRIVTWWFPFLARASRPGAPRLCASAKHDSALQPKVDQSPPINMVWAISMWCRRAGCLRRDSGLAGDLGEPGENCLPAPGLWRHPRDQSHRYNDLAYWTAAVGGADTSNGRHDE